ncbi:MAG: MDR/zinc-dependent alcohol dehydrogenase-like family protein, partial [Anaerolineae bacterium]
AAGPAAASGTTLGVPFDPAGAPAELVTCGVPPALAAGLTHAARSRGIALSTVDMLDQVEGQRFDDLVLLGADGALYERLEPLAANGALINLVGAQGLAEPAQVDVGRLHYDRIGLVGTPTGDIAAGYAPIRTEFLPGGRMALLGAAGPMGQMHFQRALQAAEPPRLIVATSRVMDRLALLPAKFAELIASRGAETQVLAMASAGRDPATFNTQLMDAATGTGGQGYDDIIILAPSAQVVAESLPMLAPGGVMNIFAGLPRGTKTPLDLRAVAARAVRLIGSSGSMIGDLRHMLEVTEEGELDPNLSVVAIAGLSAAKDGLEGVIKSQFPGKVVIYPQVLEFPLTMLTDLRERLPRVYEKLGPNESWTVEAEAAFLREMLK